MQSIDSVTSLFARRSLTSVESLLSQSAERLSSGLRINRAKEDAAGLGISQELQRQTRAFAMATRNANDAISMVQTAEGSLQSVSELLIRLKGLSSQGVNESLSKEQRSGITAEMAQLRDEINAITERTTFNSLKLLRGDFSQAVRDEFVKASELDGSNNSVLDTSSIKINLASAASADTTKSRFSISDVQVDRALEGKYTLSNDGAVLTLSSVIDGETKTEQLTLVSGSTTGANQVVLNNDAAGTMLLNFSKLGVAITVRNESIGSSDRSVAEVATKIAGLGSLVNSDYKNAGWKSVSGADWANASSFSGLAGADPLKVIITSSSGKIKLGATDGLAAVKGYNGASSDTATPPLTPWTDGSATVIAFRGTESELNTALKTLQINSTTGTDQITVEIVPSNVSVFTNSDGVTSYYRVETTLKSWTEARELAKGDSYKFNGLTGYLVNVTSVQENWFLTGKLGVDMWMGASDDFVYVNDAINRKNNTNVATYANQSASEGKWYWIDGPEAGTQILTSNSNTAKVSGVYSNFASGEPNNYNGSEDYAQFYANSTSTVTGFTNPETGATNQTVRVATWNDLPDTSLGFIVEYGGVKGVTANTAKTILIGTPGYINVGDAVEIKSVSTTGVGTRNADTGIYRLTADSSSKTVTLSRFDVDGETLLGAQTLIKPDGLGAGRRTALIFDQLGVSLELYNAADRSITLGDLESGLEKELTVASSRIASLIGVNGPSFQTGEASRSEFSIDSFKDMRLGKNDDARHGVLFNEVDSLITALSASIDPDTALFQELENRVEGVIEAVATQRAAFGAIQNRLGSVINTIQEQSVNLSSAKSQIEDTDFAWEAARLTRLQIGQQAATAMLAQANAIPNVIMALIE